ncbi:Cold-responsive protein [Vigna angularis]|uniref:Cold-responsive protein n=1 Tax=Phaseolus angularis TaxID=3914 RepID=A0A8T0KEV0_PHAAN|nr:Cold-responsive protein [Vigna angularis]
MTCFPFSFGRKVPPVARHNPDIDEELSGIQNVRIFTYKELRVASDNFSQANKIGQGGFGFVYKGLLKDGNLAAIKVLSAESTQGVKEFMTEINVISEIEHENLVKLYGCCVEGNNRILVYNYLENNSLAQTLLGSGYLAPEYALRGHLTRKADIYSFGVLLVEIVSGRCHTNTRLPIGEQFVLETRRELVALVDASLDGHFDAEEACKFLKVGLLCTQDTSKLRPPMSSVVKMLTGEMDIDESKITKPGLISDFMDLKIRGDKKDGDIETKGSSSASDSQGNTMAFTAIPMALSIRPSVRVQPERRDWISYFDSLLARLALCSICSSDKRDSSDEEIADLEVIEVVADGGYGRVYRCLDPASSNVFAVKQIAIIGSFQGVPSSIIREVSLLKELHHENIVRLLKVYVKGERHVNLVFEHFQGDLHDYIRYKRYRNYAIIKSFMQQILAALEFCHSRKILHRDLKPGNVLVDEPNLQIKLADFGLAREFRDDISYTDQSIQLGTAWYRAPEMLFDNCQYSSPIDLWAAGCVFAEMLIGGPLFITNKNRDELEAIFRLLGTPTEDTWPGITQLMPSLHNKYPKYNPVGMDKLFPQLEESGQNLLARLLCLNPIERISASAALNHDYFKDVDLIWEGKPREQSSSCIPFR